MKNIDRHGTTLEEQPQNELHLYLLSARSTITSFIEQKVYSEMLDGIEKEVRVRSKNLSLILSLKRYNPCCSNK